VRWAVCFAALSFYCVAQTDEQPPAVKFGTTVVINSGLRGRVYHIHRTTEKLPKFSKMKPVGTIYTTVLNVPPQAFSLGFPGVTKKFEWFAIDYTGRFWIEKPGVYTFVLTSDDGANLYIDGELTVDNDGIHPPKDETGTVVLSQGIHSIRLSYFQGPRFHVALVLRVAGPGERLRIFNMDEFKPPAHPADWSPENEPTAKHK
jgi:hypothetical protein